MNFALSDDHLLLQQSIRDFTMKEVAPGAAERDLAAEMPQELRDQLTELGLMGVCIPAEYGGAGLDCVASTIAVEEISKACAGTGVFVSAHNSLCVDPIMAFGTAEQKKKYLPMLAGGTVGCLSLTEPGSGSDANAARCMAVQEKDCWRISGSKIFVTNGKEAGVMVLIAVTDPGAPKHRLSAFIVEQPWDGLRIAKVEKKLGIKCSSTAEFVFEDCLIPRQNLLGEVGEGLHIALATLDGGRIGIAAQALGIAEACLHTASKYANTREQFGRPIARFQAIQNKIADMAVRIEASRNLIWRAAWLKDKEEPYGYYSAMAKLYASETASLCANHAVQVFGGYGYCQDYPAERFLRDAKITELYEGTSEIHRIVIWRGLLKEAECRT
ncbi:MAG: acyl-CoA dehydrogenase family protein [Phycisphaerae bacterium]